MATQTCRALWAPNPREAYECMRLDGHGGFHLDDQLNMMWRSSHGDRRQPTGDARHSVDKADEPSTEPPMPSAAYIHGALDALADRINALEQGIPPEPVKAQPTCTAAMEVSGAVYDCIRSPGHGGYHQDSDPGNREWALRHL